MKPLLRRLATFLCLALTGAAAWAAEPRLNGMAIHAQLGKEQFIAAVYAETPTSVAKDLLMAEQNKAMELRILEENLFARRFQRMWIEGIAINAGAPEMQKHAQHLADFSNLLRNKLTTGDRLRIERLESQKATRITLNGHLLGTIEDARFFDLLLRTWLGPVPLSSQFKDGLLAAGTVDPQLVARFNGIAPSSARTAEIAALLQPRPATPVPAEPQPISRTPAGPAPTAGTKPGEQTAAATTPEPEPPKPVEPPPPEELLTAAKLFDDEAIFDDDPDAEAYAFTAENLLSEQIYIAKLTKWTSNFVKYPRAALRNQQEGTIRLTVTLHRDGRIQDVQVLEKSEHETLNKAATRAVKSASPYPAVPPEIPGERFLFTVPVVFKLQ